MEPFGDMGAVKRNHLLGSVFAERTDLPVELFNPGEPTAAEAERMDALEAAREEFRSASAGLAG